MTQKNPYSEVLDQVEKPARYIGGEHFAAKKDWEKTKSKIALCFPDVYEIGMSHLGFKILYEELNKEAEILADRVFAPWFDMEEKMRERKLPLVGLEQFRSLSEYQILGFSLQYELTYTNILNMLDLGGVPVWQKDRKEEDPFVIAGGPCATHPEPIAPFLDFIVIGDGECLFNQIAHFIADERERGTPRLDILKALSSWHGIYVPCLYEVEECELSGLQVVTDTLHEETPKVVNRFIVEDLKKYPFPTKSPIPHMTAIFDRYAVELSRGCTEGCRFCQAGMIYRPVRERDPQEVIDSVMAGMKNGGFNEASLTCLSTADYSAITPLLLDLLDKMTAEQAPLGISSLRAYGLDKRIFDKLAEVKNSSLTFAPEAGTQRMRNVINKNISEEDMLKTAEAIFARGWSKMKLYFMIGLPTEEMEDVQGIMETSRKAKEVARKRGVKNPNITVSVSTFVPKPHTPFQWSSMIPLEEINDKQNFLNGLARNYKLNFRKHVSRSSVVEGVIARGDRKIANVIFKAWQEGARFDGWHEGFSYERWMQCLEEENIELGLYLGTIRVDARLPWDHIDVGLEEKFLEREWKKAIKGRLSPPCGKPVREIVHYPNLQALQKAHDEEKKKLVCYHCGVECDLSGMVQERREFLTTMKAFKDEPYVEPVSTFKEKYKKRNEVSSLTPGYTYRFEFAKIGAISFISHLDLQKIISRIFKRAGIVVKKSTGFNPRPIIAFGPALSLGISSLSEYFDVKLEQPMEDLDKMMELLQENSEQGIYFHNVKFLETKTKSIQEGVNSCTYYFPSTDDEQKLKEVSENMLNQSEINIEYKHHKSGKQVVKDLRSIIKDLGPQKIDLDKRRRDLIQEVTSVSLDRGMFVELSVNSGVSIKPSELKSFFERQGLKVDRPIKIASQIQ